MFQHGALGSVGAERDHPVPPAFADEEVAARGADAERIAQPGSQRAYAAAFEIEHKHAPAAAAFHQIVHPLAVRTRRRPVGGDQRPARPRPQRVDRMHRGIVECHGGRRRGRRREYPYLAPVQSDRDAAIRQAAQCGDGAIETPDLGAGGAVEAQDRSAVGDVERLAVGGEVFGRVELPDDLGLFQHLVRLQRAVERRHGDGRIAPSQQAVGEIFQGRDHLLFPQRRSYWTKPGSAPSSL